ncbi:MAG: Gfo/Idh/MocA family oxidoreductase [Planctomycetes bacterium]|nr:Gfo/Idh/MocA family oxidoreductase [Planctomycetota bacterium]
MSKTINWGILGCGGIAGKFADDLAHSQWGELAAVGSRSKRKANAFAKKHNAPVACGSYEELVTDADVDAVYVATPHPMHMEHSILAMRAGKAVLCEKPVAMNAKQLRRMIKTAQKNDVFFMEGMWSRFLPATVQLRKWLREKRIGRVLALEADFGIHFKVGPKHRINNPTLGGGALLDLGIYPVSFASMVYAEPPKTIVSAVHMGKTGVDDQSSLTFQYDHGATAMLACSSRVEMNAEARIYARKGMIAAGPNFYRPQTLTLQLKDRQPKTVNFSHPGNGFQFEADHIANCLRKKKTQSNLMPLDESLEIMQTMDRIRKQWKLKYPDE